jgi:hypothetical protein
MIDRRIQTRSYIGTLETFYVAEGVRMLMIGRDNSPIPQVGLTYWRY